MTPNETTRPVCSCCGAIIETDDYYEFDGSILCDDCYHSETVTCEHCGDRIWADDNAGTDSMPLCNSCYDDYYTTCECCGRIIVVCHAKRKKLTSKIQKIRQRKNFLADLKHI